MIKNIYSLTLLLCFTGITYAQVHVNESVNTVQAASSYAFLDGSQSAGYDDYNSAGKGILFPRTNLTLVVNDQGGNATNSLYDLNGGGIVGAKTYYDGLVVFNVGTGAIPSIGMGTSAADVAPGFYYYRNLGAAWNTGVWTPLGGGASSAVAIADGVASDSYATINATQEKVVRLANIVADGVNTTLDLNAALTAASVTIVKFRKAAIYNAAGDLVMHATGGYTTDTDILVTGNGMMNKLLPAGDYSVEVYYTE